MLRHAMQYLLKSNVSIGMIDLLFKLPFYIFRKHFRCFKDITFCSGIVYLRNIVNINNPNVPVSVRRSL